MGPMGQGLPELQSVAAAQFLVPPEFGPTRMEMLNGGSPQSTDIYNGVSLYSHLYTPHFPPPQYYPPPPQPVLQFPQFHNQMGIVADSIHFVPQVHSPTPHTYTQFISPSMSPNIQRSFTTTTQTPESSLPPPHPSNPTQLKLKLQIHKEETSAKFSEVMTALAAEQEAFRCELREEFRKLRLSYSNPPPNTVSAPAPPSSSSFADPKPPASFTLQQAVANPTHTQIVTATAPLQNLPPPPSPQFLPQIHHSPNVKPHKMKLMFGRVHRKVRIQSLVTLKRTLSNFPRTIGTHGRNNKSRKEASSSSSKSRRRRKLDDSESDYSDSPDSSPVRSSGKHKEIIAWRKKIERDASHGALLDVFSVKAQKQSQTSGDSKTTWVNHWVKYHRYHSLFINCGGEETNVNGITFDQDNATSRFYTSPKKNWAYSSSGDFLAKNASSSDYTKNMTCGVSVAEAPLYDRARLSPVSLKYYAFCLREGNYTVTLKFAEIVYTQDTDYTSLKKRAFDVYIQDEKVLHNFHIREQARGPDLPITKNFTAVVKKNNSLLMIHMYWDGKGSLYNAPDFNGPLISALSVTPDFKIDDEKLHPLHIALIAIASTIIGMLLLLAFAWSMGWLRSRNLRRIKVGEEKTDKGTQHICVTLKELIDATGKFSEKKKIGDGSLGTVYKAQLQESKSTVAVKKLSSHLKEKEKEKLEQEIKFLYALNHTNVIKLFDCHIEKDLQLLVYEYMENKSLEDALSVDSPLKFRWDTRLNICLGIAKGLEYLHNHPTLKLTHMNIKADNILLDGNLEPKISDFRLAHLYAEKDQFEGIKREVSQGYMPPEYYQGILTSKADVYSFGVILLVIVSWKRSVSQSNDGTTEVLVITANEKEQRGKLEEMVDEKLDAYNAQQALTILRLALKCTSTTPSMRPTMSDVVSVLLGKKTIGDLSKFSPNDGEKIKGSGDLTRADSTGTSSLVLTSIPSTSSPSIKAKDELESM